MPADAGRGQAIVNRSRFILSNERVEINMRLGQVALATAIWLAALATSPAADKPNVVIFYADDLGWGETGCQGCKDIPTPHIDSLAKNGVRFTQGYVAAT